MSENIQPDQPQEESNPQRFAEILRLVVIAIIWTFLFVLSFFTYFSIPFLIFITWFIIAALIKFFKREEENGSGYDRDF